MVKVDLENEMAAYYAKQMVHPRTLFSYERDNVIHEGDTVIIYEKQDLQKQVVVSSNGEFKGSKNRQFNGQYTAQKGAIKHEDLIKNKERYGTKIYTSNKRGFVTVLRPTSDMYTRNLS